METVLKDLTVFETDLFLYTSSRELVSATNLPSSDFLIKYVKHYEESGIIDWVAEKKMAHIIPNLDDDSGEMSSSYFLFVPLTLRDAAIGFAISRTSISPLEINEAKLQKLAEDSYYAALALDNIRSREEIENMNLRLRSYDDKSVSKDSSNLLTSLLASITQEIDNAIKVSLANVQLIENGVGDYLKRLSIVKSQIEKIESLNNKLDSINSNTAGSEEVFALSEVIDDVILFSGAQLQRDGIIVKKQIEKSDIKIKASKSKIEQALLGALLFSRDKLEDGGRINIALVKTRGSKANIIIDDDSIGLNESEMETIFSPLVINPDKNKNTPGLSASKKIIESYKGKIEVITEQGKGVTYKISLPLYKKTDNEN
jgi:C4-dicarboxylate-specific signal transduction histidine kinase